MAANDSTTPARHRARSRGPRARPGTCPPRGPGWPRPLCRTLRAWPFRLRPGPGSAAVRSSSPPNPADFLDLDPMARQHEPGLELVLRRLVPLDVLHHEPVPLLVAEVGHVAADVDPIDLQLEAGLRVRLKLRDQPAGLEDMQLVASPGLHGRVVHRALPAAGWPGVVLGMPPAVEAQARHQPASLGATHVQRRAYMCPPLS